MILFPNQRFALFAAQRTEVAGLDVNFILHNRHEYGPIDHTMTILRPLKVTTLLTPYEQYFIQTLHQEGQLIPEQFAGEKKPPFSACH